MIYIKEKMINHFYREKIILNYHVITEKMIFNTKKNDIDLIGRKMIFNREKNDRSIADPIFNDLYKDHSDL